MKQFIFLLAGVIFFSASGWANHSSYGFELKSNQWNTIRNQSFIFIEDGIEFSIFQDGQFDFFIPRQGPNVSIGFASNNVNFSFNTGYNYNPYVQYDNFGAIIQIHNTPIFYDYYGRVNQVGNIFIDYNNSGFVNRIGGLRLFYRNNVLWNQRGFINRVNRRYVWKPWHRYYSIPSAQFCLVSLRPYRQYYRPVRHIYYRPYANNYRDFDLDSRHVNSRQRTSHTRSQRYAQSPRNRTEINIRSNAQRQNTEITRARDSRISRVNSPQSRNEVTTRRNSRSVANGDSGRSVRNSVPRVDRTRSDNVRNNSRSKLSNQTERERLNQRKLTENRRPMKRLESKSRKTRQFSRNTPGRNENVAPRATKRNSVQNKRSSSVRNSSDVNKNRKQKRRSTSGRSTQRIR